MARYISPVPFIQDVNGKPIVNAKLFFFESGTTALKTIYSDSGLTIPISNPVLSDANGQYTDDIFLDGIYKNVQQDDSGTTTGFDGVTIWTKDPIGDIIEGQFELWLNDNVYNIPEIVLGSNDEYYRSIVDGNQGNDPTISPTKWEELELGRIWNTAVTYAANYSAFGSDGNLYISKTSINQGNDPTSDTVNWRNGTTNTISPTYIVNTGFTATIDTKALTFDLKGQDLLDPSASNVVSIPFRSETLTTGDFDIINISTALSIVIPDGAAIGFGAVDDKFIYFYAINVSGAAELAISGDLLDDSILHTTVAIDATSDSGGILYSETLRADVPIQLLGRIKVTTGAVAGEWDNVPTELFVGATFADNPIGSGAPIATTSGTAHDFTSIPGWVKRITLNLAGVSTNGTSPIIIQIGDAGGIEVSGYLGTGTGLAVSGNNVNHSSGFSLTDAAGNQSATAIWHGAFTLTLIDASTFTWCISGNMSKSDSAVQAFCSGSKSLSATLDSLRLTTVGGANTFDLGKINILYE